jgi:hypothetical protein
MKHRQPTIDEVREAVREVVVRISLGTALGIVADHGTRLPNGKRPSNVADLNRKDYRGVLDACIAVLSRAAGRPIVLSRTIGVAKQNKIDEQDTLFHNAAWELGEALKFARSMKSDGQTIEAYGTVVMKARALVAADAKLHRLGQGYEATVRLPYTQERVRKTPAVVKALRERKPYQRARVP